VRILRDTSGARKLGRFGGNRAQPGDDGPKSLTELGTRPSSSGSWRIIDARNAQLISIASTNWMTVPASSWLKQIACSGEAPH